MEDIIFDCKSLAKDIKEISLSLDRFVFDFQTEFTISGFENFLLNKKLTEYKFLVEDLASKIHGLKGLISFISLPSKELFHVSEEIIKPLSQLEYPLILPIYSFIQDLIYKTDLILENLENEEPIPDINDILDKVPRLLSELKIIVPFETEKIKFTITNRIRDLGGVRKRKIQNIQIKRDDYFLLYTKFEEIYNLVNLSTDESLKNHFIFEYNNLIKIYEDIKKIPLDFSRYDNMVSSLAEKYGVKIDLLFIDDGVYGEVEFWSLIHEISNHVLRNAIIHGIEDPMERFSKGKQPEGMIEVRLSEDEFNIYYDIKDNGRGIDIDKIKQVVLKKNLVTGSELSRKTKQELLKLIFLQGVSTKENTLDDNAGRGVGASAIISGVQQFGGQLELKSEDNIGTEWNFIFPKTDVFLKCLIFRIGHYQFAVPEKEISHFRHPSGIDSFESFYGEFVLLDDKPYYSLDLVNFLELKLTAATNGIYLCVVSDRFFFRFSEAHEMVTLKINRSLNHFLNENPFVVGVTLYNDKPIAVLNMEKIINERKKEVQKI